jgi:hypothetical protein
VTAVSQDGQTTTAKIAYKVLPDDHFKILRLATRRDGTVTFTLKLPGRGTVDILETAWVDNFGRIARRLDPAPQRFAFARKHLTVRVAGLLHVTVAPNQRGQALIARHRYQVLIRLWVSYDPAGGRQHNTGIYGLRLTRHR